MSKLQGIVVGYGNMGRLHERLFRERGVEITGVVDPDSARLAIAKEQGVPEEVCWASFTDIPLAVRQRADIVVIATPTHLHFQHLMEASQLLRACIFVEKPVVRTLEELRWLKEMATRHKRIFVAEVEQYNPKFAPLLNFEGRPTSVFMWRLVDMEFFLRGERPWFLDSEKSGGLVLDVTIHDITLLVLRWGRPRVKRVNARRGRYSAVDTVEIELVVGDKCRADILTSWVAENQHFPIMASATIGSGPKTHPTVILCDNYMTPNKPPHEDSYALQAEAFLRAVNRESPMPSIAPYATAVSIALEINQKIRAQP